MTKSRHHLSLSRYCGCKERGSEIIVFGVAALNQSLDHSFFLAVDCGVDLPLLLVLEEHIRSDEEN